MKIIQACGLGLAMLCCAAAQSRESQTASTFLFEQTRDDPIVRIRNSSYEVVGPGIPGLGREERLVLRKITTIKHNVDDVGMEASTTVQAWPLGSDLNLKPRYSVTVQGVEPRTVNGEVLEISRGLEEVAWWSVYRLATGKGCSTPMCRWWCLRCRGRTERRVMPAWRRPPTMPRTPV